MSADIRKIQFSDANTFGALNPLISFDCLIDTDFGLLVLIAQKFFDTDVFDEKFFRDNDKIEDMKRSIIDRRDKNPLLLCLKNKEDADEYYSQFFDKYYREILSRSMLTDLALSLESMVNGGIIFTILCKNEIEVDYINNSRLLSKYTTITLDDNTIHDHGQYFFKKYTDIPIELFIGADMRDKSFYIARYYFTDGDNLDLEDSKIYTIIENKRCVINKFDIYSNMKGN